MVFKDLEKSCDIEDSSIIDEKLACIGLKLLSVVVHKQNEELK